MLVFLNKFIIDHIAKYISPPFTQRYVDLKVIEGPIVEKQLQLKFQLCC